MLHAVRVATFQASVEAYDPSELLDQVGGPNWDLEPERVALLVHDLLPYYLQVLPAAVGDGVVGQVRRLVGWARQQSVTVLASAPGPAGDLSQRGLGGQLWGRGASSAQPSTSCLPELRADDVVWVSKRSYSAFFATDLAVELARRGCDQLLVVGVFVAAGITATTFDALAHDVQPSVVVEATADYTRDRHAAALTHIATTTGRVISTKLVPGWAAHGPRGRDVTAVGAGGVRRA